MLVAVARVLGECCINDPLSLRDRKHQFIGIEGKRTDRSLRSLDIMNAVAFKGKLQKPLIQNVIDSRGYV